MQDSMRIQQLSAELQLYTIAITENIADFFKPFGCASQLYGWSCNSCHSKRYNQNQFHFYISLSFHDSRERYTKNTKSILVFILSQSYYNFTILVTLRNTIRLFFIPIFLCHSMALRKIYKNHRQHEPNYKSIIRSILGRTIYIQHNHWFSHGWYHDMYDNHSRNSSSMRLRFVRFL
jgi:hypothetical protein